MGGVPIDRDATHVRRVEDINNGGFHSLSADYTHPTGASLIQAFLFERPILLVPVLAAVQLLLIAVWSRRRTPRARKAVWIGFVLFPLLVVVQALVVTDRERLTAICHELARAYRDGDLAVFDRRVSNSFEVEAHRGGRRWDKAALLDWIERQLTTCRIEEPRLRQFEIAVDDGGAVVRFTATCRLVTPDQLVSRFQSAWELHFHRRAGQWLLESVQPRRRPFFPYSRLADLTR